jgi:hypothetical protein
MRLKIGDYTLPDPDNVGQSEYRALHEFLEDCQESGAVASPDDAIDALQEVRNWCDSLIDNLIHIHQE